MSGKTEYRTQPLERCLLMEELDFFCAFLSDAGVTAAEISFGWDSNLAIDDMWQPAAVPFATGARLPPGR